MKFELNEDQVKKLTSWQEEICKFTKENNYRHFSYSFNFTETGIGLNITVSTFITKDSNTITYTLDLSEYEKW